MPSASATNTTGETGRNVAVPRSLTVYGCAERATARKCSSISARRSSSTGVGGSSVMWVGIDAAIGSPNDSRHRCSSAPYGSGMGMATPITRSATAEKSHPLTHNRHGTRRDRARPRGALGEDLVELVLVGQQLFRPLPDRGQRVGHQLGEILLELPVPRVGVAPLEVRDRLLGERGEDPQQVGDARLVLF